MRVRVPHDDAPPLSVMAVASAERLVPTATGPVDRRKLGRVLVSESIVRGLPGFSYWDPVAHLVPDVRRAASDRLASLGQAGVNAVLDTTPVDHGRDPELLREVAQASGLNVALGIGFSSGSAGPPAAFARLTAVELAEIYIDELTGATASEIPSAAITVDVGPAVTGFDELVALAVSFAHAETGAPVLVRADSATVEWSVLRLAGRGIDPHRILVTGVDHSGAGWNGLSALAKLGVSLGVSGIGGAAGLPDQARASLLAYLSRVVGAGRVCLAMSWCAYWLGPGEPVGGDVPPDGASAALAQFRDLAQINGISGEEFDELLTDGARAWLGG